MGENVLSVTTSQTSISSSTISPSQPICAWCFPADALRHELTSCISHTHEVGASFALWSICPIHNLCLREHTCIHHLMRSSTSSRHGYNIAAIKSGDCD